VDWKAAPRTVVSFDQFLDCYKGDTDYQLAPFAPAVLSTGTPVELGLSIDTVNKEPCAVVPPATSLIVGGILTNNNCSAYFSYSRNQRVRTSTPTERVSLRSNNLKRLELLVSFAYSSADMSTPLEENFAGLITRTHTRAFDGTGVASANRISDVLDVGATLHLTQHLCLIEKFYSWAYRIPQDGNFSETDNNCTVPTSMHAADSAERHHSSHDAHLDPVVLQPELEEKSNRTGLGHFEKSRSPCRLPLWRPGLQSFQRLSARRLGPFRGPGENGAVRILGTTDSRLALEFRSGAHELQSER
jgi:hypothetical protein